MGMIADTERKSKTATARQFKEAIKGKDSLLFFNYAEEKMKKLRPKYSVNTYNIYLSQLNKFKNFVKDDNLMFDDITVSMLKDYILYAQNTLKNNKTSQKLSMTVLTVIFKHAIEEDLIPETLYPFRRLKMEIEPSKRLFLSEAQFEKLCNVKFNTTSTAELYRDLFMFSVSAGGLRFSDVITLTWDDYNEQELTIRKEVKKTGRVHSFKIGSTALKIINKYKRRNESKGNFIFPAIKQADFWDLSEAAKIAIIRSRNGLCGVHLRKIGKELKFPFSLTFHLSRHTFATMALNKGMRIEHVSKLLDHRDISTTQIYAKIVHEELNKAVDEFVI